MRVLTAAVILLLVVGCGLFSHSEPVEYELAVRQGQQLALLDLETGRTRVIADSCFSWVRISPDGQEIAIVAYSQENTAMRFSVYVVDISGQGGRRRIGLIEQDGHVVEHIVGSEQPFAWSPDGSLIAFTRCLNCELGGVNTEVYLAESSTGLEVLQLTDDSYPDSPADWSPSGASLLISSSVVVDTTGAREHGYFEVHPDGTNRELVPWMVAQGDSRMAGARYSPDGASIAFVLITPFDDPDGYLKLDWEIFVVRPDGTGLRRVTNNSLREFDHSWSPDGSQIAFVGTGRNSNSASSWTVGHIWVVDVQSGQQSQVTHGDPVYASPDWFPVPVKR